MKNYYEILEISFGSEIPDVKKAYRRLAFKYHPDKNSSENASEIFIELTEAYEVLKDSYAKSEYDRMYERFFLRNTKEAEGLGYMYYEQTKTWADLGRRMAKEYAAMNFDDFLMRIYDEFKLGLSYVPSILFILFCVGGAFVSVMIMVKAHVLIGFFFFLTYATVSYYLYERAKKDYLLERKHRILNKYN